MISKGTDRHFRRQYKVPHDKPMFIPSFSYKHASELHWFFAAVNEADEAVAFSSATFATEQAAQIIGKTQGRGKSAVY